MIEGEAPANLDRRHEMRFEARHGQAERADERRATGQLDRPVTEAMHAEAVVPAPGQGIAGRAIGRAAQGGGDAIVGVERREGREVFFAPGAQDQAFGAERRPRTYIRSGVAMPSSSRHSSSSFSTSSAMARRERRMPVSVSLRMWKLA